MKQLGPRVRCNIGKCAQQGVPETLTFRDVIKSRVWSTERLLLLAKVIYLQALIKKT